MAKITWELDTVEDAEDIKAHMQATKIHSVLWEIVYKVSRKYLKYEDLDGMLPDVVAEKIFEDIYTLIEDNEVDL